VPVGASGWTRTWKLRSWTSDFAPRIYRQKCDGCHNCRRLGRYCTSHCRSAVSRHYASLGQRRFDREFVLGPGSRAHRRFKREHSGRDSPSENCSDSGTSVGQARPTEGDRYNRLFPQLELYSGAQTERRVRRSETRRRGATVRRCSVRRSSVSRRTAARRSRATATTLRRRSPPKRRSMPERRSSNARRSTCFRRSAGVVMDSMMRVLRGGGVNGDPI